MSKYKNRSTHSTSSWWYPESHIPTKRERERDINGERLLPLQLIFSVAILYHKMEPQVHVVLITGNSALSAQRSPETHNYYK